MTAVRDVWCGWCRYYTTKEAFEKVHVPRHQAAMLRAVTGGDLGRLAGQTHDEDVEMDRNRGKAGD